MREAPAADIPTRWDGEPRPGLLPFLKERADRIMGGPESGSDESLSARTSRKLLWLEGLVSNASESFVTSFMTPFALTLGATSAQIGSLASATNVASAFGLLPGARLEERYGCRKRIFVLSTGVLGRLLVLALVFLPFLLDASMVFYGLLAFVAARGFLNQLSYPAWSTLVADLVPEKIRGRYFGSRNMAVSLAALVCTPLAGFFIKAAGPRGYQLSFIVAAVTGFAATALFTMIKEPKRRAVRRVDRRGHRGDIISIFRTHKHFGAFTALGFLLHLSLQVSGPFHAVYQIEGLGAGVARIGILGSIGALTGIIGQRVWGVQNDRRGAVWVMRVTGFLTPATPFAWGLVPSWSYLPAIEAVSGFVWAGYWLASFNLLVRLAPEEDRSRSIAVYQSAVAIASFIGPVLGGILVGMIAMKWLFWMSAAGRLIVSVLFLFLIKRDRAEAR